jgi:recombinational DNA repair protein RecT
MQGRGGQTQGNGNGQRGVQGRPDVKAREKSGEEKVIEIFADNKAQIMGLLATENNAEAGFLRAQSLAVAAYRKAQADSETKIDELSMCTCCIWALRQKLDVGTEVWPVPYKGKITPIISPDGMITLIMRSGLVTAVNYSAVYAGDEFEHVLGTTNEIKHRKTGKRPRANMSQGRVQENPALWEAIVGSWCVIDLKSGGKIVVYFNKDDLAYFRSLSPVGESSSSPWAKYGDSMSEIRALKRAAKRAPKSTETSAILLSSEDSDGIEIPEEIMRAVGARMLGEMTGEVGPGTPTPTHGEAPPETQHSKKPAPKPGDPTKISIPWSPPQPTIFDATDEALVKAETYCRGMFEAGKWPENYFEKNAIQLATIRQTMRDRNAFDVSEGRSPVFVIPPQAFFDAGVTTPAQAPSVQQEAQQGQELAYEPGMNG